MKKIPFIAFFFATLLCLTLVCKAQHSPKKIQWIRPVTGNSPARWGIQNGIVFSLWPTPIGSTQPSKTGGPRGLLRMGYNFKGATYLINFIAIEPVVNGDMEFSEISDSRIDGEIGKFIWSSADDNPGKFYPFAITKGRIKNPDSTKPHVEELTVFLFMEQFLNGAHPYLKVSIRSDRPDEIKFQIFNQKDSAPMQRCALTATMGNYSRLRLLYLKDRVVDSRKLYNDFDGIHFVEKDEYKANKLMQDSLGNYFVAARSNESFAELSSWPQEPRYLNEHFWRYRPFFMTTQYWRTNATSRDSTLQVRVNGRTKYWAGASKEPSDYMNIPGGVAFENFEIRKKYNPGQKFYFGITRKKPRGIGINISQTSD